MSGKASDKAEVLASEAGCHIFSGCGFPSPGPEIFEPAAYGSVELLGVTFHITKPVLLSFIGVLAVLALFYAAFRSPKLVPGRMQNVGELGYLFVRDHIAYSVIGKKGEKWVPFLVAMFFYIWMFNILAVIPAAQFPVTSRLAFPAALSAMVWLIFNYLGIRHQGFVGYFRNMMFPPGVPKPVYVLLAPIEFFSTVMVRPFTLAVRLFANMYAGHLIITVFSVGAWYLLSPSIMIVASATSFVMAVLLTGFELLIQFLQAFIFTILTATYIQGALEVEH